ncbi:branched-chain amino acid transaminase [Legionella jamestowniensis]|uniref:Branched-chain-amino-acid aminotransferase n=1 Tax=Legionella jamestowniensis TaxID=455 RepID=A0A0W0UK47_9GAMM|nr:branched-chain amino acid transaminase [Legionella jamestowniensis]KTD08244.1 D-alanine-aminotransferase [Legionella jamestowniensis]OCH98566.1 branched-chain amino acid aminotransferase [Legionella jamestowniensis]SFL97978.1 branched-chain amino acid aminotransferase [Legionella jamestowniensis DSM 19215]
MQVTETIWQNGNLIPWADAKVHVLSHTLHYGGGAFEGIRFYKTAQGPAIFRLNDHVERLFYSASVLKMTIPYTKEEVSAAIKEVVVINRLEEGYIRPLAFYGYGKMGVNPTGNPTDLIIACWPWGAYLPHESIDVKVSSFIRIHPESTVVDAKICGHYVNSILASLELQGTHYHEALLLDSHGNIMEGVGENFFIVKNTRLYTPKLGGILSGITRDTVIKLAHQLGLDVFETDITLDEAYQADEAFFTGTAAEVTAIRSINDRELSKNVGNITTMIKKAYMDLVHGKNEEFIHYLTYV